MKLEHFIIAAAGALLLDLAAFGPVCRLLGFGNLSETTTHAV